MTWCIWWLCAFRTMLQVYFSNYKQTNGSKSLHEISFFTRRLWSSKSKFEGGKWWLNMRNNGVLVHVKLCYLYKRHRAGSLIAKSHSDWEKRYGFLCITLHQRGTRYQNILFPVACIKPVSEQLLTCFHDAGKRLHGHGRGCSKEHTHCHGNIIHCCWPPPPPRAGAGSALAGGTLGPLLTRWPHTPQGLTNY